MLILINLKFGFSFAPILDKNYTFLYDLLMKYLTDYKQTFQSGNLVSTDTTQAHLHSESHDSPPWLKVHLDIVHSVDASIPWDHPVQ